MSNYPRYVKLMNDVETLKGVAATLAEFEYYGGFNDIPNFKLVVDNVLFHLVRAHDELEVLLKSYKRQYNIPDITVQEHKPAQRDSLENTTQE